MTTLLLTIKDIQRPLLNMDYEYFRTSLVDKDFYSLFLQKNFPFDFQDEIGYIPSYIPQLPEKTELDKELMFDAHSKTSFLGFRTSPEEHRRAYYDELMLNRYTARLDRTVIPNLYDLYDMEARPLETKYRRATGAPIGGMFNLEFESTSDDNFFYEWLRCGSMEKGEITVYREDEDNLSFRIRFCDCFCFSLEEQMCSTGTHPMTIRIRISPAIVYNRTVLTEKNWKISNVNTNDALPEPIAPPVPLITAVEGTKESFPGGKVRFKVTQYNMKVNIEERNRIKWALSVDGGESVRLEGQGEQIELIVKPEWSGKELTVMPYLKTPTEQISVKVKVEEFIIPRILTETDRKAGLDEAGNIARDMHFGKAIKTTNGEWIFSHTTGDFSLSKIMDKEIRAAIEKEMELDDTTLFKRFRELVKYTSTGDLQTHNLLLVDRLQRRQYSGTCEVEKKFYLSKVTDDERRKSEEHSHPILTKTVFEHESTKEYIERIKDLFVSDIKKVEGNANYVDWFIDETRDYLFRARPRFSSMQDTMKGLRIALNDTWGHRITLSDYKLDSNKYYAKILIRIFDHFGLDISDVEKFGSKENISKVPDFMNDVMDVYTHINPLFYPYKKSVDFLLNTAAEGFRAWYILQHCKGFKPFITVMEKDITIEGEL